MGTTENTIFATEIRAVLKESPGESASASNGTSDVLATFNFEQQPSLIKLKIFKKKLEAIIEAFETYIDLQKLPEETVRSIKDALSHISSGFYPILADSSMESATITVLKNVLRYLIEAQSYVLAATTVLDTPLLDTVSFDEEKKIRWPDYYQALLKCRHQMFEIKKLLKALKLEPT